MDGTIFGSAAGRMYPAPTASKGGAVGFGAPGGRALRGLPKCGKQTDKHLFDFISISWAEPIPQLFVLSY